MNQEDRDNFSRGVGLLAGLGFLVLMVSGRYGGVSRAPEGWHTFVTLVGFVTFGVAVFMLTSVAAETGLVRWAVDKIATRLRRRPPPHDSIPCAKCGTVHHVDPPGKSGLVWKAALAAVLGTIGWALVKLTALVGPLVLQSKGGH